MFHKFINLSVSVFLLSVLFIAGCSAQQTEQQALQSLREMTRDGKLPPENVVADIESRFAGKRTGALAKLLHARIRFENNDFAGAASILNSDVFRKKTKLEDHALWLRGRALESAGNHAEAVKVLSELINNYPNTVRLRDAKLLRGTAALTASNPMDTPMFLVDLNEKDDADALLITAKGFEYHGSKSEADEYYRRA